MSFTVFSAVKTYFRGMQSLRWLILCLLTANSVCAQRAVEFEVGAAGGFLVPHHNDMHYLQDGHTRSLEAALHFTADGSKAWHHHFNFPTWGISGAVHDAASQYLGTAAALTAFIDFPLDGKRILTLRTGLGAGYISRPFHPDDNFHNGAIGSRLNSAPELTLNARIGLSPNWILRTGIGIRHFSNGAFTVPNSGINLAVIKAALSYRRSLPTPERLRPALEEEEKEAKLYAGGSFGAKQAPPYGSPRHGVANGFLNLQKRLTAKSGWGAEIGMNMNGSLAQRARRSGREGSRSENFRAYIAAEYRLYLSPIALRFQAGSYIFPEFEDDGLIFFKYHIIREFGRWQVFAGLKSHFAKADNIEAGAAYRIR